MAKGGMLWRMMPALLGLACAITLTATLITCSGTADRMLSDWVPSDDYGERACDTYTLVSEDDAGAPALAVTPPSWVVGVAAEGAADDNPSCAHTHLTCTFETGHIVYTYATDEVDDFLAWQLDEDTIITSHLFGGRYTHIEVGTPAHAAWGGHDLAWGTYAFDDEYGRRNVCYVSAAEVAQGQVLTVVSTETLPDGVVAASFDEATLEDVWQGISW